MDCAAKFEQDVAASPGVSGAELNFGASKIRIVGDITYEQLAAIGEAHHIQVRTSRAEPSPATPWWLANPHVIPTAAAAFLVLLGEAAAQLMPGAMPSILCYGAAILVGGFSTARKGVRAILRLSFDMNALMTIAVTGAALIGQWGEGAVVAMLFGVSETLESYTMDRARRSIQRLMEIAPKVARVRRAGGDQEIPVEDVQVGDLLLVRPGERLAMDGVIAEGHSAINQAAITGESMPVEKGPSEEVYAGSINGEGGLEVRVTKLAEDTTLARIIYLVEEAQGQRAPTQTFVERFAKIYTPAIMLLALLIAVAPPLLLGLPWSSWIYRALSLLVVGCPCALVVSTPVTVVSAIANGARHGVLIKGGAHLEAVGSLKAIAFDKTGTLTLGRPEVTDVAAAMAEGALLDLAAAVEANSEHPLARAIRRRAGSVAGVTGFQAIVGRGAKALVEGQMVYVGSPTLFRDDLGAAMGEYASLAERWQREGKTVMLVGSEAEVAGAVAVADGPREESRRALAGLKQAGIGLTVMLTGDNGATARAMGGRLGVDEVRAELLPEAKVAAIQELVRGYGKVGMVGDGVNDAPALAAATVGIAMGGAGTDVALETADIALMGDDLSKLPFAIQLGRQSLTVIKQNIGLALALKLLAVVAVFPGWLTLWLAILADMGATILVTLNGMRMLRLKPEN